MTAKNRDRIQVGSVLIIISIILACCQGCAGMTVRAAIATQYGTISYDGKAVVLELPSTNGYSK